MKRIVWTRRAVEDAQEVKKVSGTFYYLSLGTFSSVVPFALRAPAGTERPF